MTTERYHPVHILLSAWLVHTIVNDFLSYECIAYRLGGEGQLGLTDVSESLSSLYCNGMCVCVCVCVTVRCHCVCDGTVCVCVHAASRLGLLR